MYFLHITIFKSFLKYTSYSQSLASSKVVLLPYLTSLMYVQNEKYTFLRSARFDVIDTKTQLVLECVVI